MLSEVAATVTAGITNPGTPPGVSIAGQPEMPVGSHEVNGRCQVRKQPETRGYQVAAIERVINTDHAEFKGGGSEQGVEAPAILIEGIVVTAGIVEFPKQPEIDRVIEGVAQAEVLKQSPVIQVRGISG